jgi:hypothetical protein
LIKEKEKRGHEEKEQEGSPEIHSCFNRWLDPFEYFRREIDSHGPNGEIDKED